MTQIDELVKRARDIDEEKLNVEPWTCEQLFKTLADALEAQAARVKELEAELDQAIGVIEDRRAQVATLEAQLEAFREALTPSAETKADYIGEFNFNTEFGQDEEGTPYSRNVTVPWTTVKEIMKAVNARAALRNAEGEKNGME